MSREDVEVVRQLNQAFNKGTREWAEFYDPEAELRLPPGLPAGIDPVVNGRDPIRRAAALWTETVFEYRWDIERLIDAGDCIVGLFYFRSRIKPGDEWLNPPLGAVFYLREGRIVRLLSFFSWEEALQAAGVRER